MKQYTTIYNPDRQVSSAGKQLQDYQKMARNFLSIDSGNDSLFIWYSTGRGKTMTALAISEPFSKLLLESPELDGNIYVIGSYASIENFINELIGDSGNAINGILPGEDGIYITAEEKKTLEHLLRKVSGDPRSSFQYNQTYKKFVTNRLHAAKYRFYTYQKFINLNIENLNNSLIIIDEAHNLLNANEYSQMLKGLTEKSTNYKLVLLSATPMFNHPTDIVDFLNLLFKKEKELKMNQVFRETSDGLQINLSVLNEKMKGKIAYMTTVADSHFPKRIDIGVIPKYLKETKLVLVPMSQDQIKVYKKYWNGETMTQEIKYIINAVFNGKFDGLDDIEEKYLSLDTLANHAPKYYEALKNINEGHKVGKSMVYQSYVNNSGIKLIERIFRANGYLDYNDNYIRPDTRDRLTGRPYSTFTKGSTEWSGPARFAIIHGDIANNERNSIIDIYNDRENMYGEKLSVLIGSQLLRESVDLKCTLHIHVLNYQENYSRLDQILGRGIRYLSHAGLPDELWYTKIYKYCSSLPEISAEEMEYIKDEANYLKMKEITNSLKTIAIDCKMNMKYNTGHNEPTIRCVDYSINNDMPEDSYLYFYSENETYDCILYILDLFRDHIVFDYESLVEHCPFDREIVNYAINRIIFEEISVASRNSRIVRIGDNFLLQPLSFDKETIDINLRTSGDFLKESSEITEIFREIAANEEQSHKINISDVYAEIRDNQKNSDILLYKYDKQDQAVILEDALKVYIKSKKIIPEEIFQIMKTYKRYLIDENEFGKDINTTPFDKYFDSVSWNEKDTKRNFVGHFLNSVIRIYNEKTGKFDDVLYNYMKTSKERNLKDNPFGIGSLARDQAGNIVFKIRDPIQTRNVKDMRKLPRGYVCNRVNSKQNLYKLLNNLEVDYDPNIRITDLCMLIEKELRERQSYNNKHNLDSLWFEDIKF